jgi:hypothetical protein
MGSRLLAGFFVVFAVCGLAKADTQTLDCNSAPGGYLCRQIHTIQSFMDSTCTGDPCDSLFRNQAQSFTDFVNYYNQNVFSHPTASAQLGDAASHLASTICAYRWTGDSSLFSDAIFQGNLLLSILQELQKDAGRTAISTCSLSIQ